jgi:hypothetical protein
MKPKKLSPRDPRVVELAALVGLMTAADMTLAEISEACHERERELGLDAYPRDVLEAAGCAAVVAMAPKLRADMPNLIANLARLAKVPLARVH